MKNTRSALIKSTGLGFICNLTTAGLGSTSKVSTILTRKQCLSNKIRSRVPDVCNAVETNANNPSLVK